MRTPTTLCSLMFIVVVILITLMMLPGACSTVQSTPTPKNLPSNMSDLWKGYQTQESILDRGHVFYVLALELSLYQQTHNYPLQFDEIKDIFGPPDKFFDAADARGYAYFYFDDSIKQNRVVVIIETSEKSSIGFTDLEQMPPMLWRDYKPVEKPEGKNKEE